MNPYKLSDFKVGQIAYLELVGRASKGKQRTELVQECVVEKVTKQYVTASGIKFEPHYLTQGLRQHTSTVVEYVLYPNKERLEAKLEKEDLLRILIELFQGELKSKDSGISLDKLRTINEIINS